MADTPEDQLAAAEDREDAHLAALEHVGVQVEAMAATGQELVDTVRDERARERRRDLLLYLMIVLLLLKLASEGLAWQERNVIKKQGHRTEQLVETVNRCINPAPGKEPDCGQDRSRNGNSAAQAVIAINNFQLDVAACQASVAASEYEACVQQRQAARAGDDGG